MLGSTLVTSVVQLGLGGGASQIVFILGVVPFGLEVRPAFELRADGVDEVELAVDDGHAGRLERLLLGQERARLEPRGDDGPGVAHGLALRGAGARDEGDEGLGIPARVVPDVLGQQLFLAAADLPGDDDEIGGPEFHGQRHEVAEGRADGPVAADADDGVLGDADAGHGVGHVVEDGPAPRDDGHAPRPEPSRGGLFGVEDVGQHADLDALGGEDQSRRVPADEDGLVRPGRDDDVPDVPLREPFRDEDDERDAGLDGFDGGLPGGRIMAPDAGRDDVGEVGQAVLDGIVDGDDLVDARPRPAGRDAGHDRRPEIVHQPGVLAPLAAETEDDRVEPAGLGHALGQPGPELPDEMEKEPLGGLDPGVHQAHPFRSKA